MKSLERRLEEMEARTPRKESPELTPEAVRTVFERMFPLPEGAVRPDSVPMTPEQRLAVEQIVSEIKVNWFLTKRL